MDRGLNRYVGVCVCVLMKVHESVHGQVPLYMYVSIGECDRQASKTFDSDLLSPKSVKATASSFPNNKGWAITFV